MSFTPSPFTAVARLSLRQVINRMLPVFFLVLLSMAAWTSGRGEQQSPTSRPPSILFIVADDLGIGDLACYGNPYLSTPRIDRLAAEGVRLTDYYAASPLCASSRASLLTGRYNHRTGAVDVSSNRGVDRLALSEKTFGDYFRHAGYATALIGKWHNGLYHPHYLPHARGFDLFYGFANGGHDYWQWHLMRNGRTERFDGRYLIDALTDEAIAFVEENRDRPFALFLAHPAPHSPFQAPQALIDAYLKKGEGQYGKAVATIYAMIEAMDTAIGRVVDRLEELGLREDTWIVFTSDNGAILGNSGEFPGESTDRFHGPFRGNKDAVYEQGIRVPAIVSWRGTLPPGTVVSTPVHGCDWLPTFLANVDRQRLSSGRPFDGKDVTALLKGQRVVELENRALPFQKNRYTPVAHSNAALRKGPWKLVWPAVKSTQQKDNARDGPSYARGIVHPHWEMPLDPELPSHASVETPSPSLYHLGDDPSESVDLAARYPGRVVALQAEYDAWFASVSEEWTQANRAIREEDRVYWSERLPPDPRVLFADFWRWQGSGKDPRTDNPLSVFRGYWSSSRK